MFPMLCRFCSSYFFILAHSIFHHPLTGIRTVLRVAVLLVYWRGAQSGIQQPHQQRLWLVRYARFCWISNARFLHWAVNWFVHCWLKLILFSYTTRWFLLLTFSLYFVQPVRTAARCPARAPTTLLTAAPCSRATAPSTTRATCEGYTGRREKLSMKWEGKKCHRS